MLKSRGTFRPSGELHHRLFVHFLPCGRKRTKRRHPCPAFFWASPVRPEHAETRPPDGGLRQLACL